MKEESFYSIDKLIEFGLEISLAKQMITLMNTAIVNMYIPGIADTNHKNDNYFIIENDIQKGPYNELDILRLISEHKIHNATFIWKTGMPNWEKAEKIPEIIKLVAMKNPPNI